MTSYFTPGNIWVGKLCYVQINWGRRDLFVPCRIVSIREETPRLSMQIEICTGDSCTWVGSDLIFDRIDGPTSFFGIPGGKP